jgi:outer membrane lipoprotein SlyB
VRPADPPAKNTADQEQGQISMPAPFRLSPALRAATALLLLGGGLVACAPQQTGTTYNSAMLGRTASVSYGTIIGLRPVQVQGNGSGVGTAAGAVAGGVAGSFVGGDWRSNALAGLGGAIIGGLAGNAIGQGVSGGNAVEFFIREDNGGDISVVQTNEESLQQGDRVVISRGDRTRLTRAAGGPPPQGYAPQQGYTPQQGYAPSQGYAPQQGYVPEPGPAGYAAQPAGVPVYSPVNPGVPAYAPGYGGALR